MHLYKFRQHLKSKDLLLSILETKCQFKGVPLASAQSIQHRLDLSISEWDRMLAHQLPLLAPFEEYRVLIPTIFDWLYADTPTPDPEIDKLLI